MKQKVRFQMHSFLHSLQLLIPAFITGYMLGMKSRPRLCFNGFNYFPEPGTIYTDFQTLLKNIVLFYWWGLGWERAVLASWWASTKLCPAKFICLRIFFTVSLFVKEELWKPIHDLYTRVQCSMYIWSISNMEIITSPIVFRGGRA